MQMNSPPGMKEIQELVRMQLGRREVSQEQRFMEDLGAESADMLNIIATAEDRYNITFDETEISAVRTVQELYDIISRLTQPQPSP